MALIMNNDPEIKRFQEQLQNNRSEKDIANAKITTLTAELAELQKEIKQKEQDIFNSKNTLQLCVQNISTLSAKLTNRQQALQEAARQSINRVIIKAKEALTQNPPGHAFSVQFLESESSFQVLYSQQGEEILTVCDIGQREDGKWGIKLSNCRDNVEATLFLAQRIGLIFNFIKDTI